MTMTTNDETVSGPFGVPAEPRPSAREAIQGMLGAGLLDDLMGRIDDGDLQLTGEGGFIRACQDFCVRDPLVVVRI